jgi:hypothetical protein
MPDDALINRIVAQTAAQPGERLVQRLHHRHVYDEVCQQMYAVCTPACWFAGVMYRRAAAVYLQHCKRQAEVRT